MRVRVCVCALGSALWGRGWLCVGGGVVGWGRGRGHAVGVLWGSCTGSGVDGWQWVGVSVRLSGCRTGSGRETGQRLRRSAGEQGTKVLVWVSVRGQEVDYSPCVCE